MYYTGARKPGTPISEARDGDWIVEKHGIIVQLHAGEQRNVIDTDRFATEAEIRDHLRINRILPPLILTPEITCLTRENFWNDLATWYPDQMKEFCDWIDEYKKRIKWNTLFANTLMSSEESEIKYHHVPIAMQLGIFFQYTCESPHQYLLTEAVPEIEDMQDMVDAIHRWFYIVHHNSKQSQAEKSADAAIKTEQL